MSAVVISFHSTAIIHYPSGVIDFLAHRYSLELFHWIYWACMFPLGLFYVQRKSNVQEARHGKTGNAGKRRHGAQMARHNTFACHMPQPEVPKFLGQKTPSERTGFFFFAIGTPPAASLVCFCSGPIVLWDKAR